MMNIQTAQQRKQKIFAKHYDVLLFCMQTFARKTQKQITVVFRAECNLHDKRQEHNITNTFSNHPDDHYFRMKNRSPHQPQNLMQP